MEFGTLRTVTKAPLLSSSLLLSSAGREEASRCCCCQFLPLLAAKRGGTGGWRGAAAASAPFALVVSQKKKKRTRRGRKKSFAALSSMRLQCRESLLLVVVVVLLRCLHSSGVGSESASRPCPVISIGARLGARRPGEAQKHLCSQFRLRLRPAVPSPCFCPSSPRMEKARLSVELRAASGEAELRVPRVVVEQREQQCGARARDLSPFSKKEEKTNKIVGVRHTP